MIPFIIIGVIAVLSVLGAWWFLREYSTPSVAMFFEIDNALRVLQQEAAKSVFEESSDGMMRGLSPGAMDALARRVGGTIRFVYTISRADGKVIHTISSQRITNRPEKYQIQCMLVALLVLHRQLGEAGIDPKNIEFGMNKSELGTHYLEMALTPDQHAGVMAANKCPAPTIT